MGLEDLIETPNSVHAVFCQQEDCEWERYANTEQIAAVLLMFHVLEKHPEAYQFETGKDPVAAQSRYKEQIAACRRWL